MAQSVIRQIERNLTASAGLQSRPTDKASIRGIHQGQRSCEIAQKGRTHDCKRPLLITKKTLASRGPSTHEAAPCSLSDGRLRFHRGRNMKCWIFLPVLAVAGCAANSGVAPLGGDAFVVTRQAATGFSG